ncbi:MAG: hypothetical protein WDA16_10475 [Candidatus Thermoplasmatota archaeon]
MNLRIIAIATLLAVGVLGGVSALESTPLAGASPVGAAAASCTIYTEEFGCTNPCFAVGAVVYKATHKSMDCIE